MNWDNNVVGFVSAVSTHGSAVARFRAAGPVGDHPVKIYTGWQGQSYLNFQQAPNACLPRPDFTFLYHARADPQRPPAYAEPYQAYDLPNPTAQLANAKIKLTPTTGSRRYARRVARRGRLPANSTLDLVWQSYAGNRVSGSGCAPQDKPLQKVAVGSDGKIELPVTIPDDLGGRHGLQLRDGDKPVAQTYFAIETSIVSITPASGPAGTPVSIHLKGVGWTEYDNIYAAHI